MEQIDISIRTGAMIANSTAAAPRMPSGSPLTSRRTDLRVLDNRQAMKAPCAPATANLIHSTSVAFATPIGFVPTPVQLIAN